MLCSSASGVGIDGNFLEALNDLRGDEFTDAGLSGDDLDGEDLAREGRSFRRVDMVTLLLYREGVS